MNIKNRTREILEVTETPLSIRFDKLMIVIIFFSIVTYTIGTISEISVEMKEFIYYLDNLFIAVFTIEYIIRIYIAENKFRYIFSFYGLVDLLSILPFYLGLMIDGEFAKALRFLRVFRLLKLTRYSKTMQKFYLAFYNAREEFVIFALITLIMFYLASVGIYQFEHKVQPEIFGSVLKSMWWSVATLTTVGYGDVYPITAGGKIFTTLVLIIGLGVVGVPAGIIAAAFTELGVNDDIPKNENNELEETKQSSCKK